MTLRQFVARRKERKMKKWFLKGIFPIVMFLFILWIFKPMYFSVGEVQWFNLWLAVGIPFGASKFVWLWLPKGYDIGGTVGIIAMGFLLSGIVGGCIAVYVIMKAFCIVILEPIKWVVKI